MKGVGLIFFLLAATWCFGQAHLVKDIITGDNVPNFGSDPNQFCEFKGKVFFRATSAEAGVELWESDGTKAGTRLVADVFPGTMSSYPTGLTVMGDKMFFTAREASGNFLWATDGTTAGTKRVSSKPWVSIGDGIRIMPFNGVVYFPGFDNDHGTELWKSDGTDEGTVLVKDINPGVQNSQSRYEFGVVGNKLIFAAADGTHGNELWTTDGTAAGTVALGDLNPGAADFITLGVNVFHPGNVVLYFVADDGIHGSEVWKTDGTLAGTSMLYDKPGPVGEIGGVLNNVVIYDRFESIGFTFSYFRSDGTDAGTYSIAEAHNTNPVMVHFNSKLYFVAEDQADGWGLWLTDGTLPGTSRIKDLGDADSFVKLAATQDLMIFFGRDFSFPKNDMWVSDGSGAGTSILIPDLNATTSVATPTGVFATTDRIFLSINDGFHGDEISVTDGTVQGTVIIDDINKEASVFPTILTSVGENLFFQANDLVHGMELWKTDGTEAGTVLVKDIKPGTGNSGIASPAGLNNLLLFSADDGVHGMELWKSDGTEAGTSMVKDIVAGSGGSHPYLSGMAKMGSYYYFGTSANQLWRSDGTAAGTTMVKNLGVFMNYLVSTGTSLYFTNGMNLWKSDGTDGGTMLIKNLSGVTIGNTGVGNLTPGTTKMYLIVNDGVYGEELWVTDGTSGGTKMVKDIHQGSDQHFANIIAVINDVAYFQASEAGLDYELWRSDGTEAGTYLIKDIRSGSMPSSPQALYVYENTLYFSADDGVHGIELWKTDGTASGTVLVKDIYPGTPNSTMGAFAELNGRFYFFADQGNGQQLWRSDGTAEGTAAINNFDTGIDRLVVAELKRHKDKFFFVGQQDASGKELWSFDALAQTMSFEAIPNKLYSDSPIDLVATTSANQPVEFSVVSGPAAVNGSKATFTGIGTVTIKALQPGSPEYRAVSAERTFTVSKGVQAITFSAIAPITYKDKVLVQASSSSGLPVTFTIVSGPGTLNANNEVQTTGAGSIVVRGNQAGNDLYLAAPPVDYTIVANKATQTVTFDQGPMVLTVTDAFSLVGEASSGLPLTYSIVSGSATIQSTPSLVLVVVTGPPLTTATVTVKASQAGNENYLPASAEKTFQFNLPSGLEDESFGIAIAPNPATSTILVRLPSSPAIRSLGMKDILGREVLTIDAIQQEMTLDVEEFPRGIYIVRLSGDDDFVYHKRIILK